jgi:hypothetical protein
MDARAMTRDVAFFGIGLAAGALFFVLLRWNTTLYARTGPIWAGAALQVLRVGMLASLLVMTALQGALPLLLTALGLLIARPFIMRWMVAS